MCDYFEKLYRDRVFEALNEDEEKHELLPDLIGKTENEIRQKYNITSSFNSRDFRTLECEDEKSSISFIIVEGVCTSAKRYQHDEDESCNRPSTVIDNAIKVLDAQTGLSCDLLSGIKYDA